MFFLCVWGLYTGMEATRKAPQGYRLCKRRLRAPTRNASARNRAGPADGQGPVGWLCWLREGLRGGTQRLRGDEN